MSETIFTGSLTVEILRVTARKNGPQIWPPIYYYRFTDRDGNTFNMERKTLHRLTNAADKLNPVRADEPERYCGFIPPKYPPSGKTEKSVSNSYDQNLHYDQVLNLPKVSKEELEAGDREQMGIEPMNTSPEQQRYPACQEAPRDYGPNDDPEDMRSYFLYPSKKNGPEPPKNDAHGGSTI